MKALIVVALALVMTLLVPRLVRADRHWEHEHHEHERWEHEHWRPRVYPYVPYEVVPPPAPACPVSCWPVNVCNPYGWCHWEQHCEPRC